MRKKEMFQIGSAYEYECVRAKLNLRRAKQNLKKAAKAQGQVTWWKEQCEDPAKKRYILAQYLLRCPKIKQGRQRRPFKILEYMEEERRERVLLLDSVKEMMDEYEFRPRPCVTCNKQWVATFSACREKESRGARGPKR